jgi:hypothetical protein
MRGVTYLLGFAGLALAIVVFRRFTRRSSRQTESIDIVEESSIESLPASDSPPWNPPGAVEPTK